MTPFGLTLQIIFFGVLLLSMGMIMFRLLRGPHMLDRIMAVDSMALVALCLMAVLELAIGTTYFFDALLVLSIVGFISAVVLSRYVQNGDIIE